MAVAPTPTPPPKPAPAPPPPAPKPPEAAKPPAAAKATLAPEQQHAALDPDIALSLFTNGHRIARDGDPQTAWISMGRALDGVAVLQQPMSQAIIDMITTGSYFLVDDQAYLDNAG